MRIRDVTEEHEAMLRPAKSAPTDAASAHGKGEWKLYADGSRKCKVSVSGLKLMDGTILHLSVNGRPVGEVRLERGSARFKRESEKGEFVLVVRKGEILQVSVDSRILLEGAFYLE